MTALALHSEGWTWHSADEYRKHVPKSELPLSKFHEVTDLLLDNPNLNSSHLFRADILLDSSRRLKSRAQKEQEYQSLTIEQPNGSASEPSACVRNLVLNSVPPCRTVVRQLIPRNQNLDRSLQQTCYFYSLADGSEAVVYVPDVESEHQIPWYHPKVRALAYVYESADPQQSVLSIHIAPYGDLQTYIIPDRLHRTLLSLSNTFIRLCRINGSNQQDHGLISEAPVGSEIDLRPSAIKDTIVPQHIVQDTYARLKTAYAAELIAAWVELTPPEKHVFEDLAIAAFLVCLWEKSYGSPSKFPGFVDLACGNGLLVHILLREGWHGMGLDARRRKTWDSLSLGENVQEKIIVPSLFLDKLRSTNDDGSKAESSMEGPNTKTHNAIFGAGTFLISNHADELTIWTPILAALSDPADPLPFLNIPCCSHALSGEKHRYNPKEVLLGHLSTPTSPNLRSPETAASDTIDDSQVNHAADPQPHSGSLKALRAEKLPSISDTAVDKSMYACLTRKTVQISRRLGIDVQCTLMRIPSTRNIGVVHLGKQRTTAAAGQVPEQRKEEVENVTNGENKNNDEGSSAEWRKAQVIEVVERECQRSGGMQRSAEVWIERARRLHAGGGGKGPRGKVNLGGPQQVKVD
ncbi:tRNA (uracil-O(2)-)-methyltransferase [Cyphellophora attinorum]|uniref:tRNA (uracil-O(2)-)-methyltransferase n=1 Tax=Cyphellophora attinorum TaxID=1664694 RepID=A0A0N1NZ93_9EURO|nr:tRNA (uracil-O(2)-)-methyltransferase [Phialophora attinorum]KPI41523.1 tRNA (uracil-O(2)-)-methyltransferase [Phialophora attinorum]